MRLMLLQGYFCIKLRKGIDDNFLGNNEVQRFHPRIFWKVR